MESSSSAASSSASNRKFNILQQIAEVVAISNNTTSTAVPGSSTPLEAITNIIRRDLEISLDASIASRYSTKSVQSSLAKSHLSFDMDTNDNLSESALSDHLAGDLDAVRINSEFVGSEKQIEVLREVLRGM